MVAMDMMGGGLKSLGPLYTVTFRMYSHIHHVHVHRIFANPLIFSLLCRLKIFSSKYMLTNITVYLLIVRHKTFFSVILRIWERSEIFFFHVWSISAHLFVYVLEAFQFNLADPYNIIGYGNHSNYLPCYIDV